jgi:hypothetical protein
MTSETIESPIENLRKKLRLELKSVDVSYALADGGDSNFNYLAGKADGLRLAVYLLSKELEKAGEN